MVFFIALISLLILVGYGTYEKKKNEQNIRKIPVRVNVNGIRGKSTITRLITSILADNGYNTVGKTTGTASRIIDNLEEEEFEIKRAPRGVNIIEQVQVIDWAAKREADALVCECMAVTPEYQRIYQEEMIKANYGVIVNVLEDHIDLLGPTLDEVALAFTNTIPYNGHLIIQNNEYTDYFTEIAKQRNTKVWVADESEIPDGYFDEFKHILFPNNIAIALAFSKAIGISKEQALKSMLKMNPDPGTLQYHYINKPEVDYTFINGFAINDPLSFLETLPNLKEEHLDNSDKELFILFNARKDRVDRSEQFINDVFKKLDFKFNLIVIGESTHGFDKAIQRRSFKNIDKYLNYEFDTFDQMIIDIENTVDNGIIFGVGNIHGKGYDFLNYIYGVEN